MRGLPTPSGPLRGLPGAARRGGAAAAPFSPEQIPDAGFLFVAPWEGGNAPASVSAEAQNPAIVDGGSINTFTDWSGNARHADLAIGTAALWRTGANGIVNGAAYHAVSAVSYLLSESGMSLTGTPLTLVIVYQDTSGSGYLLGSTLSNGTTATNAPVIIDRAGGDVDFSSGADSFDFSAAFTGSHVLLHAQDASDLFGYLDGTQVYTKGSAPATIPSGNIIRRLFSTGSGSSRLAGKIGFAAAYPRKLSDTERDDLTAWLGDTFGIAVAAGFEIASPITRSIFQVQDGGSGTVRAEGPAPTVSALEARWNGGAWTSCQLSGGRWSVELPALPGRGALEVRTLDQSRLATIPNIMIGRKVAGWGQSNMFGSAQNFDDLSANLDISMFDPRPSPQPPMFGSLPRNQWTQASDKSCWPHYLETRRLADSISWGFVRFAIGSTRIAFWEPTAGPDPAGFGYTGIVYLLYFIDSVIRAEGYNPDSYDPNVDDLCCEEVFMQIGETDAQAGTSKTSFKSSLTAIAAYVRLRLGVGVRCSILQALPIPSYVPVLSRLEAIQAAVSEAVAEEESNASIDGRPSNLFLGPDFSGVTLADPPGDGIHWFNDAERDSQGEAWAAWPIASQLILDAGGDIVTDETGAALYTETTP